MSHKRGKWNSISCSRPPLYKCDGRFLAINCDLSPVGCEMIPQCRVKVIFAGALFGWRAKPSSHVRPREYRSLLLWKTSHVTL